MPNIKSAKKELRKSARRAKRNNAIELEVKKLIKQSRKEIIAQGEKARELVLKTLKALDKAAQKGIIKMNTRDRNKSRLHKKLNTMTTTGKKK